MIASLALCDNELSLQFLTKYGQDLCGNKQVPCELMRGADQISNLKIDWEENRIDIHISSQDSNGYC